jgi:hypothetical protein
MNHRKTDDEIFYFGERKHGMDCEGVGSVSPYEAVPHSISQGSSYPTADWAMSQVSESASNNLQIADSLESCARTNGCG